MVSTLLVILTLSAMSSMATDETISSATTSFYGRGETSLLTSEGLGITHHHGLLLQLKPCDRSCPPTVWWDAHVDMSLWNNNNDNSLHCYTDASSEDIMLLHHTIVVLLDNHNLYMHVYRYILVFWHNYSFPLIISHSFPIFVLYIY